MSTSPGQGSSRNPPIVNPSSIALPASPQRTRTIRRLQSHQTLSSNSPSLISQQRQQQQLQLRNGLAVQRDAKDYSNTHLQQQLSSTPSYEQNRTRANSDAGVSSSSSSQKRPGSSRKSNAPSLLGKGPSLDSLLREGPPGGNIFEGLQELRYLILSTRIDADGDGMSPYRIYVWLTLLDVPPVPTDDYLSLIHRGRCPAYAKIRNDTFRTLTTDPLFKRRVTEGSLIRLLNAVAWKLYDAKKDHSDSRPINQNAADQDGSPALDTGVMMKSVETSSLSPAPASETSTSAVEANFYVQGMNVLCAPFLYAARSEVEAYALFHRLLTSECPGYIRGAMDGVHKGLALVDKCLSIVEPKLANYLLSKGMHAELYAFPSVLTFCACTPPLPEVLHLWDFLFAYGPHLNILCIVAQLIRMRDEILGSPSPTKILRSFPLLDAKEIIALTVLIVRKIPDHVYEELVFHAR